MTIEKKLFPHVEKAVKDLYECESDEEAFHIVLTLAAKLKLHDDGRDIDRLSKREVDAIMKGWLAGENPQEANRYIDYAIDLIIEYIEDYG